MDLDPPEFGSTLRALRIRAGKTLRDVAIECGVQVSAVSKWERGAVPVPLKHINGLSRALGVKLSVEAQAPSEEIAQLTELARQLDPEQLVMLLGLVRSLVKKK